MSTVAPFLVGLVTSGVGYAYLSRELVTSRNRIMLKHFKAEGIEPFYPTRKMPRGFGRPESKRSCPNGSRLGSNNSDGGSPAPAGEHPLIGDARNRWNAVVLRCSEAVFGTLYGSGSKGAQREIVKDGGDTKEIR